MPLHPVSSRQMMRGNRDAEGGNTAKKGRPRIAGRWINRIYELAAKGWGPGKIERQLEKEGAQQGRDDAPHERTIRRYLLRQPINPAYREFHWPQAMLDGLIPWEAADFALTIVSSYGLQR